MTARTIYFKNCLGVFQGGGCRAAAFAGAYAEAIRRGVSFSSLVGTSAGSIVATLIAGGAKPPDLERIIRDLDFEKFLRPPAPQGSNSLITRILTGTIGLFTDKAKIITYWGMYSSEYIEEFIETELKKLLPESHSPVQFRDLVKPVSVVAADIRTHTVKVWSSAVTPTDEVSFAVRASCNIPLFFQPLSNRYIDGGVLSNLPSFVFSDVDHVNTRILAFCLEAHDNHEASISTVHGLARSLADTLIDGAQDLQLRLQKEVHVITIPTGTVKATDFDRMNTGTVEMLVQSGKDATKAFFDEETLRVKNINRQTDVCPSYMQSYNVIAQTVETPIIDVIVSETTTDWVYKLFPTLLHWRMQHAPVAVLLKSNTDDSKHGPFRQRLLSELGCNVKMVQTLPFKGFLFNSNNKDTALAVVRTERTKQDTTYDGVVYSGRTDFPIISMLRQQALTYVSPEVRPSPQLTVVEPKVVHDLLKKNVHQYAYDFVNVHFTTMKVSDLMMITKYVTGFKYTQVNKMFEIYQAKNLPFFVPAKLLYSTGKETIITPPVVEIHGHKNLVIEGTTRVTYSYRNEIPEIQVFLVEGVKDPLPSAKQFILDEMVISDEDLAGSLRYDGFNLDRFRSIERAVRNPDTTLL